MPDPVYSGTPVTVTLSCGNCTGQTISFEVSGCGDCTVAPTSVPYANSVLLTITSRPATNARLKVSVGSKNPTNSNSFDIVGITATKLLLEAPASSPSGTPFNITVTARDASDRIVTGNNSTVILTSTDPLAKDLGSIFLANGTYSGSITLLTTGSQTITGTSTGLTTGTDSINVTVPPGTRFRVDAVANAVAGIGFPVTVTALDANGNVVTGFTGTVTLTSTDSQSTLVGTVTISSNGTGTLPGATLKTVGSHTITATASGDITGTSGSIGVTAGPATSLVVSAPSSQVAGSSFNVLITAKDAFGNTSNYTSTVTLSSTDTQATGMGTVTLTGGIGTYSTTHKTVGTQAQRITATGNGVPSISGFADIVITAAAVTRFVVSAPQTTVAGTEFNFIVTARDQFGNLNPTYSGTVGFTASDTRATLPAARTLTSGLGTFPATLRTAGSFAITATETTASAITGASGSITVAPGALAVFFFLPATQTQPAGTSFSIQVTAEDEYSNRIVSYTRTANVTSSDSHAQLPATVTFNNGAASFQSTLLTTGVQTITVTDQSVTSSTQITVQATAATRLDFSNVPSTAIAGTPFSFNLTAKDASGNTTTGYAGTLAFTTPDTLADRPPNATLSNGTGTFDATLRTAGTWIFTATDTANATIRGTSSSIVVQPGAVHHLLIEPVPSEVVAGVPFNFTATAKDQFNNTVGSYTGPVTISSMPSSPGLPAGLNFSNGIATGQATLTTAVATTLTITSASISASANIAVTAAVPNTVQIVSGDNQQKAIRTAFEPLTVRVVDAYENPIRNWQVTFTAPNNGASATFSPSASPSTTVTTNNDGVASVMPTANDLAGVYSVAATASERPQLLTSTPRRNFTLRNLVGLPSNVQVSSGTLQSTQIGTPFSQQLVVTVRDVGGNLVSDVEVTLTAPGSGASATLTPAGPYRTNASGTVTVNAIANAVSGSFSIATTVTGADSTFFALTNLPTPPGSVIVTQGSSQNTSVEQVFAIPLEVRVMDASSSPIADTPVTFYPVAGTSGATAQLSGETLRTNAAGVARVTATANTISGGFKVRVVALTGGTADFDLTNTPGAPANIEAVLGAQQSTQIDSNFSEPLRVRVVDRLGNAIPAVDVTFQAPASGASAITTPGGAQPTNAQGYVSVTATANTIPGSYFVFARTAGVDSPATFSLRNIPQSTSTIVVSGGSNQTTVVGSAFAQLLQVTVRDGQNAPIPNVTVTFTRPSDGPSVTLFSDTVITDAQGQASVRATANTVAGSYQVEASAPGISAGATALFNLTNRAGAASSITADPGTTPQYTRTTIAFPNPLRVTVRDTYDNPISGATVTYSAPSSGPSAQLSGSTNITDAEGKASVRAVANGSAGNYSVTSSTTGPSTPATFSLSNSTARPATIEILSGNAQTTTVNSPFAQPITVVVKDANGNRLAGQTLTLSAPQSGASAAATVNSVSTDGSGQAMFTLTANMKAGIYSVQISGPDIVSPVVFQLSNNAGPAARLSLTIGASQLAFAGSPFAFPLAVIVQDAFGNPVTGASVSYQAQTTGATALLSATSDLSGPSGVASVNAIAGSVAGAYVVTASVAGVASPVTFNLTNVAVTPGVVTASGGANQNALVNTGFITPLTVTVRDVRGNPVAGVTVRFSVPESGASASLSERTLVTNSQGVVSINAVANEVAGPYQVTATVEGFSGPATFNLQNRTPSAGQAVISAIVNAASFNAGAAPGGLETIFGSDLATATVISPTVPLPTTLGDISVTVAGRPVPLLYVSPTQINFQLPADIEIGRPELVVMRGSTAIARAPLQIDQAAPGIFLQIGGDPTRAAALNSDYSLNTPSVPAPAGGYVLLFATGLGQVSPTVPAGQLAPRSPLSLAQSPVSATIGPRPVAVQFAGKAPTTLGDQVNLQIPADLPAGEYAVAIRVNGVLSNSAIISVGGFRP